MVRRRKPQRVWEGITSIQEGDRIKWQYPSGVLGEAEVATIRSTEVISPDYGICIEFFSDRVKDGNGQTVFASFQRVVPEEWITHLGKRRVRSSGQPIRTVDSSTLIGTQTELPLQEGGQ